MFTGYALLTEGLTITSAGESGLVSYAYALVVPFLQVIILGKRVRLHNLAGLAAVLAGMYIFTSAGKNASGWNRGDTLTFLAAVSYAFNIIYLDKYTRIYSPAVLTGLQFGVMAVLGALYSLLNEDVFLRITQDFVFSLFYLVVFGSAAAIFIMNRYQKGTTPVRAVVIYAMEPVLAVLSGWILLGEKIGFYGILGGGVIIGGVLVSEIMEAF